VAIFEKYLNTLRRCVRREPQIRRKKTVVLQNASVATDLLQPVPVKSGLSRMPQFMMALAKRLQNVGIVGMVL